MWRFTRHWTNVWRHGLVHSWRNEMPLIYVQTVAQCQNLGCQYGLCLPWFAFKPRLILDPVAIMTFLTLLKSFDHHIFTHAEMLLSPLSHYHWKHACRILCIILLYYVGTYTAILNIPYYHHSMIHKCVGRRHMIILRTHKTSELVCTIRCDIIWIVHTTRYI